MLRWRTSTIFGLCALAENNAKIVYSSLNVAGLKSILRVLTESGYTEVVVEKEQERSDGCFPICPYPNPDMQETMALGIEYAKKKETVKLKRNYFLQNTPKGTKTTMIIKLENPENARKLFGDWSETMIWSCLQGVMGEIYGDDAEQPRAAMAWIGDFCFFAGKPDRELVRFWPLSGGQEFMIVVLQNQEWARLLEEEYRQKLEDSPCFGDRQVLRRVTRYAMKKEGDVFDRRKLWEAVAGLDPQYTLKMIDEELYYECRREQWSRDLVAQFPDYEHYQALGLGVVVLDGGKLVAGASSYTRYREGIEIEIDTSKEYRRRGLAYACGARLILECLSRGLYPSWDAHNRQSVGLAEKLGYHLDHEYEAFEVWGNIWR